MIRPCASTQPSFALPSPRSLRSRRMLSAAFSALLTTMVSSTSATSPTTSATGWCWPTVLSRLAPRGVLALPYGQRPFHDSVMRASSESGVDAKLLHAVITVESGYNQTAVSPKGATGLMQLMPATARRYGKFNLLDANENIRAGASYLRDLLAMFDNNLELALAAYNAGENAVIRHGRRLPPYAETQRYVPLVVAHYRRMQGS